MLIAAMVLGLIGGITYFVGGGAWAIGWQGDGWPWVISCPNRSTCAKGAALVRTAKPAGMIRAVAALGSRVASLKSTPQSTSPAIRGLRIAHMRLPAGLVYFHSAPDLDHSGGAALSSGKKSGAKRAGIRLQFVGADAMIDQTWAFARPPGSVIFS
jgi:hypothetical protein